MQITSQKKDPTIVISKKQHAKNLAELQIKMGKEVENRDLIQDLVVGAMQYITDHNQLGFFLTKLNQNQKPIGSLMLTFENSQAWWIQSVFVEKQYRRNGYFKSLFKRACQIAKQHGVKCLKLYVNGPNIKAKQTYTSLGMFPTGQKFYSYDFVYGGIKIQQFIEPVNSSPFRIIEHYQQQKIKIQDFKNLLHPLKESKNKKIFIIDQSNNGLVGFANYFNQFSDFRFGLIYFVESFMVSKQSSKKLIDFMHRSLCRYFKQIAQIKLAALRYIFMEGLQIQNILENGQIENYQVMQINI